MHLKLIAVLLGLVASVPVALADSKPAQSADDGRTAETWAQFRGPNCSGLAPSGNSLPTQIGPDENVVWKVELPSGHSSPIVCKDRIYLTAERDKTLLTIALDRATGKTIWERVAPYKELEQIHGIGTYAQCTPATDGRIVVSLFGSSGLFCYDRDGNELWTLPMGPFNTEFGAGTSPIIQDDRVLVVQDHDTDSFLMAIDKTTGKPIWKADRSEFLRNYCSPVIWSVDGKKQIVIPGTLRVVGYDFGTGKELWTVHGLSRAVCVTPVVGDDNILYVAGWANGGDADARISIPPIQQALATWDKNQNGSLEDDELVKGDEIERRFSQFDRDKTGSISQQEYEYYRSLFDKARNVMMAIRPGGRGDLTRSNVMWEFRKFLPLCACPLHTNGCVFMVKNGGIVTSLNARTGEPVKTGRASGTGNYYASPVAGDGKIYLIDERGRLSVLSAEAEWRELANAKFDEDAYATPAIVGGRIYLRTRAHLYCFGLH